MRAGERKGARPRGPSSRHPESPAGYARALVPRPLRLALVAISLPLLFEVALNGFLASHLLERLVSESDRSVLLHYDRAWALWPSRAHVAGLRVAGEDPNVQFELDVARATLSLQPLALVHKRLHARWVQAEGASFRLRPKLRPESVAGAGLSSWPILLDFSGPPLRAPGPPPPAGPRPPPGHYWTVVVDSVDGAMGDVWIGPYRLSGPGHATGRFTFEPKTLVDVDGHLDLAGASLEGYGIPIARALTGTVTAFLPPFDPMPIPTVAVVGKGIAHAALGGELLSLRPLHGLLRRHQLATPAARSGSFSIDATLDHGRLAAGSHAALRARDFRTAAGPLELVAGEAAADASVDAVATGPARLKLSLTAGPLAAVQPGDLSPLLEGARFGLTAETARLDLLHRPFGDLLLQANLASATLPNLARLGSLLPPSVRPMAGHAVVDVALERAPGRSPEAAVDVEADGLELSLPGLRVRGSSRASARLFGIAPPGEAPSLVPTTIAGRLEASAEASASTQEGEPLGDAQLQLEARLEPSSLRLQSLLERLSGAVRSRGVLARLDPLAPFLPSGIGLTGGRGRFHAEAEIARGDVLPGSRLELELDAMGARIGAAEIRGTGRLHARVAGTPERPEGRLRLSIASFTARLKGRLALRARSISLALASRELRLWHEPLRDLSPRLAFQGLEAPDLDAVRPILPQPFSSLPLSGRLLVDGSLAGAAGDRWTGKLALRGRDLRAPVGPLRVAARVDATADLAGAAPPLSTGRSQHATLGGSLSGSSGLSLQRGTAETASLQLLFDGRVPERPFSDLAPSKLIRALDATIHAGGQLNDLSVVDPWLAKLSKDRPLRAEGEAGIAIDGQLAKGHVLPGARVSLRSTRATLASNLGLTLETSASADVEVIQSAGDATLDVHASLPSYELSDRSVSMPLLRGSGATAHLSALLPSPIPWRWPTGWSVSAGLGAADLPDLASAALHLPQTSQLRVDGGGARLRAAFSLAADGRRSEDVRIVADETRLEVGGNPVTCDWNLLLDLSHLDAASPVLDLRGSSLTIRHADVTSLGEPRDWWGQFEVKRGALDPGGVEGHPFFNGSLSAHARDLLPLLDLYGTRLGIPGILDSALDFEGFDATGELTLGPKLIQIDRFSATGEILDARGRLRLHDGDKRGQILLTSGPLAVGADVDGKKTSIRIFGARSWFDETVRAPLADTAP